MGIWQKRLDDLADEANQLTAVHARLGLGPVSYTHLALTTNDAV